METYKPVNLKLWTLPDNYFGANWPDYYVAYGQHRDSNTLTRSNFRCLLKAIGGEEGDSVIVVEESHWAVGWVQWIGIHKDNAKALQKADAIIAGLEDYPVISDDDLTELEHEETCQFWENVSTREKARWCKEAGVSIFAARRGDIPEQVYDRLRDSLY
jgi:hypothetical protein